MKRTENHLFFKVKNFICIFNNLNILPVMLNI
jgi:hypothetical protein